ncbi:gliding motility-associated C-terminal domain-containing protein [Pedobacter frigoris]|uniref:Gliding motility-associated C-terminal domain-containing protein n=1 Tax=Pedobacter frigoris TaxID=2571272 RepID=A0A4U1CMT3_9SPHI|nr:gliding motility-associated C-terminal domain-containing protein [Pedobacter frigoris]TKC08774.1 gliding motility-associated C-terminal domain-containing protein [Pedobacter frigoris]
MTFKKLAAGLLLTVLMLVLAGIPVKSQVCTGSLGDPVINIDFGRGSAFFGPGVGSNTSYNYNTSSASGNPHDGDYSIAKTTAGMNSGWYTVQNHTPNDPDGYMMVVNASETPGMFYESTVAIDLCPNTTYEFAAWIVNILRNTNGKKPNITFSILTLNDDVLQTFNTGDIDNGNPEWKQYGFLFQTTNASAVKIRMINNGPGGSGNDLALDDITFRACGPSITTKLNSADNNVENICEGGNGSFNFNADVQGSPTLRHQWQFNLNNSGWNDVPNEITRNMQVTFSNASKGTYQYRFTAAEPGNFSSVNCRTVSQVLTINVNPLPVLNIAPNKLVCLGDPITLDLTSTGGTYAWTGPNGYTASEKSPTIPNATASMSGLYKVVVTSSSGCITSTQTNITVIPRAIATVAGPLLEICKGSSAQLMASGGTTYRWSPAEGLSATDIPDPSANPQKTTTYKVVVSNGICESSAEVKVVVLEDPKASAGTDKKILEGQSTILNGNVSGNHVTYSWSPSDGLDDPSKINPVASPKRDITYTLTAISDCNISTDEVFIRVYPTVMIRNAFSPNGDGVNDTWKLEAVDTYKNSGIKVMNRYGELVFQSIGYEKPWDGRFKNEDLPIGVYYYIINLDPDLKPLTGSVTILR